MHGQPESSNCPSNVFEVGGIIMCNGSYLDFMNINAYTKHDQNPSIISQDTEHKGSLT